ncbi:hypothetical protein V8B97DRAFT_1982069 [Scleroderma yunnanense]
MISVFWRQPNGLSTNRMCFSHRTWPTVLAELAKVTNIASHHLTDFYPGMDDARSRL